MPEEKQGKPSIMPDFKPVHTFILVAFLLISGTVGAFKMFAERAYAEETRQMVVMLDKQGEMGVWEDRKYEMEEACVDKKTDDWLCSPKQKGKYNRILRKIQLLEIELGIRPEPESSGGGGSGQ